VKATERLSSILSRRACVLACIFGVILASAAPNRCHAQDLKAQKADINRILRGGKLAGAEAKLFSDYFRKFFGQFLTNNPGPETFHDLRKDLEIFLRNGKSGDAYNQLVNMANRGLTYVANDAKRSAAVRLNAVLVVGNLKDQEPNGNPLPAAYLFLNSVVSGPPEKYPDQMKVAAMIGLERYAASGILPPRLKDPLTATMLHRRRPHLDAHRGCDSVGRVGQSRTEQQSPGGDGKDHCRSRRQGFVPLRSGRVPGQAAVPQGRQNRLSGAR
jgi:hypothetical protein